MKNLLKLSAVAMTVVTASAAAPKFAASFNAGTAGIGAGLDVKVAKDFTVGATVDYFGLAFNKKSTKLKGEEGIVFDKSKPKDTVEGKRVSTSRDIKVGINAKYHPFSNGFFVGAGLNLHKASLKTTHSVKTEDKKVIKIFEALIKDEKNDYASKTIKATRFTPAVSLGYKANVADNIALGVEAGVEYIGTWKDAKKAKEGQKAQEESGSKLARLAKGGAFPLSKSMAKSGFLPSIKVGVSYAF